MEREIRIGEADIEMGEGRGGGGENGMEITWRDKGSGRRPRKLFLGWECGRKGGREENG